MLIVETIWRQFLSCCGQNYEILMDFLNKIKGDNDFFSNKLFSKALSKALSKDQMIGSTEYNSLKSP